MEDFAGQFGNDSHGDVGPLAESPIKFGRSQKSENFSNNAVRSYWVYCNNICTISHHKKSQHFYLEPSQYLLQCLYGIQALLQCIAAYAIRMVLANT